MAQPYQGIRISLNNTDVNKVRNDFNSLVNELKNKAGQPINFKINSIGIKDSLKQEAKNVDELIAEYKKLGTVKVKPLAFDAEGNLQKFKLSIQQASGVLDELIYKRGKADVGGKLQPFGNFELKGIKELDNSEKVIKRLATTQNTLYRELNNLQKEEFNIKQQLIGLEGKDKQLLEEKLNIIRQQQQATGQLLSQNNLKDSDKNNSVLLERLKLTNELKIAQENYNKSLANQMANKRESGKTPTQQQLESERKQAEAVNRLLDSNYNSIVNFQNKQNTVLNDIKQKYKGSFTVEEISKFEQELGKLSPRSETLQNDFANLERRIKEFKNAVTQKQYDTNLGQAVKTKTPFNFNADISTLNRYAKEIIGTEAQITKVVPKTDEFGRKIREVSVRTKEGADKWHNYTLVLNQSDNSIRNVDKGLSNVGSKVVSLGDKMKSMLQGIAMWAGGMTLFYGTIRKFEEGIELVNTINKSQTNIMMIAKERVDEYSGGIDGLTQRYSQLARDLYTTNKDIMAGSEEFLRAGKNIADTEKMLKASTIGSKISGQDNKETAEQLIAISNGLKISSDRMMEVVDKISYVDNNSATSFRELATAMRYTSASAENVNVSFEQLLSYIGIVSSVSRRSAETIGQSFKTIFSRYEDVKGGKKFDPDNEPLSNVERDMNKIGIAIRKDKDTFKDFNIVLDELSVKWKTLTDVQKSTVTKALAG